MRSLGLVLSFTLLPNPLAAQTAKPPVEFDSKLTVACRNVTPANFKTANPDQQIVEATLRISANLSVPESSIDTIVYRLRLPEGAELADYLPKTELGTDVAGPIDTTRTDASRNGLVVAYEGGAKIAYRFPVGVELGAHVSGSQTKDNAQQTSSSVQIKQLPPKQLILAAGTTERGRNLYFKLRPFTQITLEGEKEFACLLIVPKDWTGGCLKLDCQVIAKPGRAGNVEQTLGVGFYLLGDTAARTRVEKLARDIEGRKPDAAPAPVPTTTSLATAGTTPTRPAPEALPEGRSPLDGTWATKFKIGGTPQKEVESTIKDGELRVAGKLHWKNIKLLSNSRYSAVRVDPGVFSDYEHQVELWINADGDLQQDDSKLSVYHRSIGTIVFAPKKLDHTSAFNRQHPHADAHRGAAGKLEANRDTAGEWEEFKVVRHDDGEFSFQAHTGYLCAEGGGGGGVIADRKTAGEWEKWKLVEHNDGTVSLQTKFGHYLSFEKASARVVAEAKEIGEYEKFTLSLDKDKKTGTLKCSHGRFISAQPKKSEP